MGRVAAAVAALVAVLALGAAPVAAAPPGAPAEAGPPGIGPGVGAGPAARPDGVGQAEAGRVVVVGVAGLRWEDVGWRTTPHLAGVDAVDRDGPAGAAR